MNDDEELLQESYRNLGKLLYDEISNTEWPFGEIKLNIDYLSPTHITYCVIRELKGELINGNRK